MRQKGLSFHTSNRPTLTRNLHLVKPRANGLDGDKVAREMRRAFCSDGCRLFNVSEFLTPQHISSYLSRRAAKIRQHISISGQVKKKITLLEQGKLSRPLHSSIPSRLISMTFAPWPKHLPETWYRSATQAYSAQKNLPGLTWKSREQLHLPWDRWLVKFQILATSRN